MPEGLGLVAIIGAALLLIVFIYAISRNKAKDSPADIARTERATDELYREEHEAAERREGDA
ncbi:hypothetical protein [Sphingomicrobium arenosum]|uniref:hypothetical protein n=1 Tax=Sphingomicrobium arenosum TaxID=2233861 RepID=UPI002240FBC7|nr:hypothetical protein [Sphingomicrobium arenosum]